MENTKKKTSDASYHAPEAVCLNINVPDIICASKGGDGNGVITDNGNIICD